MCSGNKVLEMTYSDKHMLHNLYPKIPKKGLNDFILSNR